MKFIINNFRVGIVGSLFLIAAFFSFVQPALALDSIDTDSDGLTDEQEIFYHTDPNNADTDNDGYGDYQEIFHGYSPRQAEPIKLSSLDSDNDGAPDSWEIRLGLDLLNPDTDGDGYSDGTEILNSYNPLTSEFLPFQETTKRRRKYKIEEKAKELPLVMFAFDALYLDGKDITQKPYSERRKNLEKIQISTVWRCFFDNIMYFYGYFPERQI